MNIDDKRKIKAVIFDLDGVIVSTDDCHYKAWKRLADEEGICFDRKINERLRGVSRLDSLEIILERSETLYSAEEKQRLADRKNSFYRELILQLKPDDILPGVCKLLEDLKRKSIKIAIGSSSRNTPLILERIGLKGYFDAVVDGNAITKSKPDPEVFLMAAERLGISPGQCVVIEDAEAGVEAAIAGGMKVIGVGGASSSRSASLNVRDLTRIGSESILGIG